MPTLTMFSQSDFPAHLKWQAIAFMRCEWTAIFQGNLRFLSEPYPAEMTTAHFALHECDSLISYATTQRLSLTHAGIEYEICGFGNLLTFPPYRGEGYGQQILQSATHHLRASAADLAILFCNPKLTSFYAKFGWELTHSETRVGTSGVYVVETASRMAIFLSDKGKGGRKDFDQHPFYVEWCW